MNAPDVLKYGHLWVHKHLDGFTDAQWLTQGVCGVWSVKDIVAHLASFEWVLAEALASFATSGASPIPTPTLDQHNSMTGDAFNAAQVGKRQNNPPQVVLRDYDDGYAKAVECLKGISEEVLRRPGTIPWYGKEYSLDDLIVYQYYGHKREHCAQIAVYRDRIFS